MIVPMQPLQRPLVLWLALAMATQAAWAQTPPEEAARIAFEPNFRGRPGGAGNDPQTSVAQPDFSARPSANLNTSIQDPLEPYGDPFGARSFLRTRGIAYSLTYVGESFGEALARELMEEGRIEVTGEPELHGVFLNSHVSIRDHVAVYVVRAYRQDRLPEPNREIAECGFFARDALPRDTTLGTQLRIAEVLDGRSPIATWRGAGDDGMM